MENRYHWIIDNGHGSIDPRQEQTSSTKIDGSILTPGKRSFKFPTINPFADQCLLEGVNNREVVNYLSLLLWIASESQLPSILLSIHHNAFGSEWNSANGISTHYFEKEERYSKKGKLIAEIFQPSLVTETGLRNRGYKGSNFKMLRDTTMPAILTENGFMTNLDEATKIKTELGKQKCAIGHYLAIKDIEAHDFIHAT